MKLPDWINTSFSNSNPNPNVFDLKNFKEAIDKIKQGNRTVKMEETEKLLAMPGLIIHFKDKSTKRVVLATCEEFEYPHEHATLKKLAAENYDVILVPKGYLKRHDKKFDVFLFRGHICLEADLKCINSINPDTIAKRIKEGSEQATRLILDIVSSVERKTLIDGLKLGCERNAVLIEIMLFYNSGFYRLPKTQILSKKIFDVLK